MLAPRRRHGMARPISDEELQLKKRARRRLVGAIVLVSAVAVILPMVLDSEPKSVNQNVDIQIPPTDSPELKTKTGTPGLTIADAEKDKALPPSAAQAQPSTSKIEADSPPASKSIAPELKGDTAGSARPAEPTSAAEAAAESGSRSGAAATKEITQTQVSRKQSGPEQGPEDGRTPGGEQLKAATKEGLTAANAAYVVQVAALADSIRVKQLQKQIAGAGVKAYTEVVSTKRGHVTRVRAGPYATREAAEKARTQLKKVGLEGKVVPR
jgi:DedD protein